MDKSHARIGTIGQGPTPTPRSDAGVVDRGFRADFSFADIFPVKSDTELCYGNPVAVAGEGSQSPSTWSSSWSSSYLNSEGVETHISGFVWMLNH